MNLPRLGLGCAPLGGLYESVSEAQALATIGAAYDARIRFFDTAPYYGHGMSELRLGKVLANHPRESFVLSSKVGRRLVDAAGSLEDHQFYDTLPLNPVFDFSREAVMRGVDDSLDRLKTDYLDIALVHDPDEHYEQALRDALPAVVDLKQSGVVRSVGVGMNQWEMLERFVRESELDFILLAGRYTLLDQSALATLLPVCLERDVAVVLGGPYNSGILAAGTQALDRRYNYQQAPPEIVSRTRRLETICDEFKISLRAAALQFPLAHPGVVSVIPGARSPDEARDNARLIASSIPLDFWRELRSRALIHEDAPTPQID